jgi:hypothetical protein
MPDPCSTFSLEVFKANNRLLGNTKTRPNRTKDFRHAGGLVGRSHESSLGGPGRISTPVDPNAVGT